MRAFLILSMFTASLAYADWEQNRQERNLELDARNIEDSSGSIKVNNVAGHMDVDDGSGSITVKNVERDLIILSDGSGSVSYTNIQGQVQQD